MNAAVREWFGAAELAGLPGVPTTARRVREAAKRCGWHSRPRPSSGGGREYHLSALPGETQAALLKSVAALPGLPTDLPEPEPAPTGFTYDAEQLWQWASTRSASLRERGEKRATLLRQAMRLVDAGQTLEQAFDLIGQANDVSAANLANWYHGVNGQVGAKLYQPHDWAAALIPAYRGRTKRAEIPAEAWDWFCSQYLTRNGPTIAETWRRVGDIAVEKGWTIPSLKTFERRVKGDIPVATRVYYREGAAALGQLYPKQRRDRSCYAAGEAVSGDGLKFDRLRVVFPDGEIVDKATGWFWSDIWTGKILAYRLAKTENTDLFRLATYDLMGVCKPRFCQVDNTRVAANKAMTGRAKGRRRFTDQPNDPIGLLLQIGMPPRFTNPSKEMGSPGVKHIERQFGIGGIHGMVATSPRLKDKGYNRDTAIPYELFEKIVAEEVARFNARPKRRTQACRGVLSFDQAFEESFSKATVTKLSESQRNLLLLMPEVVRADRERGEIKLKAGSGPLGKPRYWTEALAEFKTQQLVAYYDPENLRKAVAVYTLDGRFVCHAERLPDTGANDTVSGREWNKEKSRKLKAQQKVARADRRMSEIEAEAMYPESEAAAPPDPGFVQRNFQQKRRVIDGELSDAHDADPRAADAEREAEWQRKVNGALEKFRGDHL